AYSSQPAQPQAPQLAPGRTSLNFAAVSSTSTANTLDAIESSSPAIKPVPVTMETGTRIVPNIIVSSPFRYLNIPSATLAKPMKDIDTMEAATRVIGIPWKLFGNSTVSILLMTPANRPIATI